MKKRMKTAILVLLTMVLLSGTAFADTGPKPALLVRVENGPEEPYYLDLLEEDQEGRTSFHNLDDEDLASLDPAMLAALRAAAPEGWHACIADGTRAPLFGKLTGEGGVHRFSYVGVPQVYRIVIVTQSGESWVSEPMTRRVLQCSATVDWAARTARTPPVWLGYALQFLSTLLPTLAVEGLLLLAFGFAWRENRKAFLLVNLVTQGALAAWLSVMALRDGVGFWYYLLIVPAELIIGLVEGTLYTKLLKGKSKGRAFVYGLTANAASTLLGAVLVLPVWQWIVSIS